MGEVGGDNGHAIGKDTVRAVIEPALRCDVVLSVSVDWPVTRLRDLTADEMEVIPAAYRPNGQVLRSSVEVLDLPPFNRVEDREAVVFA